MDQPRPNSFADSYPVAEETRLAILTDLAIMDTPAEAEFDMIVELARHVSGCDTALISLVDRERQWFKAKVGLAVCETSRSVAFCAHAIRTRDMTIVDDARLDPRFSANPLVTGEPGIVFYAGIPLEVRSENMANAPFAAIGTLCVIHDRLVKLDDTQIVALQNLARLAESLIERRTMTLSAQASAFQQQVQNHQIDVRNRQFRQAERMANIGSWRLDLAKNRAEWSDQVFTIHGLPIGEYPSLDKALDFYPPDDRAIITQALADTIKTGQPFEIETDIITAQGERRRVRSVGEVELRDGRPTAVVGVFHDVTQQFALEQRLRRSALEDDLTGLPNRAAFNRHFDASFAKAASRGGPLTALLIDLDGFKAVNDRCGHRAGDAVLKQFAVKLREACLPNGFAARLGGDEFVIVIDDAAICSDLEPLLLRLLGDLQAHVAYPDGVVAVSATIGGSHWSRQTPNSSELLHRADMALYAAKGSSRGSARVDGTDRFVMPAPLPH